VHAVARRAPFSPAFTAPASCQRTDRARRGRREPRRRR